MADFANGSIAILASRDLGARVLVLGYECACAYLNYFNNK
jgi:hypothetical protein